MIIIIGRQGEMNAYDHPIDIAAYQTRWPGSTPVLWVKRPGQKQIYLANASVNGTDLVWHVGAYDTQIQGMDGQAEIVFYDTAHERIGKWDEPIVVVCRNSLTGAEHQPDVFESGYLTKIGERVEQFQALSGETAAQVEKLMQDVVEKAGQVDSIITDAAQKVTDKAQESVDAFVDAGKAEIDNVVEQGKQIIRYTPGYLRAKQGLSQDIDVALWSDVSGVLNQSVSHAASGMVWTATEHGAMWQPDNSLKRNIGQQYAGQLLFVDAAGNIVPVRIGRGLSIVDGSLVVE